MDARQERGYTVAEIARWIGGVVHGDPDCVIRSARPLPEAQPGDITFLEDASDPAVLGDTRASAVIAPCELPRPDHIAAVIQVEQPLFSFCAVFQELNGLVPEPKHGIHPRAEVHPTATIGQGVYIGPGAYVGAGCHIGNNVQIHSGTVIGDRCRIGDETTLYPNVTVYENTQIGCRVVIHAGAVIGADGFGYRSGPGGHTKVPHYGCVIIEDDVEIGANSTIDRGTFGATVVGQGTKIDNQVQIAHNCKIGRFNLIAAQVGIAGSTTTGDFVVIAGQAGLRDHIEVGEGVVIGAMSGVMSSVPAGSRVMGLPAEPEQHARRVYAVFHRLPDLRKQVLELSRRLKGVEDRLTAGGDDVLRKRKAG